MCSLTAIVGFGRAMQGLGCWHGPGLGRSATLAVVPLGLVLVGILILVLIFRAIVPHSAADRRQLTRLGSWLLGGAALVLLVRFGMLRPALVGAAVWALLRFAPPFARRLWSSLQVRQVDAPRGATEENAADARTQRHTADMTRREALEVLGLADGASEEEIAVAYREHIKKVHPDRGGSADSASKVNRARDVLLPRHAKT
jgi:DnaJ homolog subfamily C member 19